MTTIRLEKVSNPILKSVNLSIADGELFVLVGPSGAGKSTLLKVIAGLSPCSGRIFFDDECIDGKPPHQRRVGYLFQDLLLFPHLTVRQNLSLAMLHLKMDRKAMWRRTGEILDRMGILPLIDRYPSQMSGGEKQRAALARAIATRPRILLLDEPFSSLDPHGARRLIGELKAHQRHFRITTLFVTHNWTEARTLADRIGAINGGRLVQNVNPEELSAAVSENVASAPVKEHPHLPPQMPLVRRLRWFAAGS